MFYKKRIDAIADKVIDMDTDIEALKKAVSRNTEDIEKIIKDINALKITKEGLINALQSDRKDLNALIAIIKKLKNKRK